MQLSVDNQFAYEANGEVVQALQRQGVIDVQQKFSSEAVRASENSTLIAHRLAAPRDNTSQQVKMDR